MAYAAVVSLLDILNQLLRFDSTVVVHQNLKPLIESLHEKLSSLRSSLKKLFPVPKSSWSTTDDLETKIRDTIYKAQDAIEYLIQSHSENSSKPDGNPTLLLFLQETIANIDSITKTADEIQVSIEEAAERRNFLSETNALPDSKISDDEIIVGQDEHLEKLKGMVLDGTPRLEFLSIVGMPGIGKTTLVKRIYNDPLIQGHFRFRAWVTISHDCRARDVLLSLVRSTGATEIVNGTFSDLVLRLYKRLFSVKYLVVIDNIWDTDIWYRLISGFPNEKNGSRVILTTPNADLVLRNTLRDPFLNDDASWELLRRVVFEKLCFPSQLERIGRKIAKNCEGLPLAIIEVGKLLRGFEPTVENWKAIEESENPLIISADDDSPLSKALTPSYKMLPPYLKACFLYMGLLPRNTDIRTSKLIRLWVSEGFIEQGTSKSLEEKSGKCLDELISRSLVLVRKRICNGTRTKTCGMHFVFRALCISLAPKEDFFHIMKKLDDDGVPWGTINLQQQRIFFHNNIVLGFKQVHDSLDPISSVRSLLFFGPHHQYPIDVHLRPFKLLRVLESIALRFYTFPEVFELVRLRYLAITYDGDLPPSISILLNLEVLVVRRHHHIIKSSDDPVNYLPIEIWNLHKLKHLHCMGSDLVDPNGLNDSFVLENLLTLSGVSGHSCVRGVLSRMPKLKKIGIRVVQSTTHIETFSFFGNFLESLFDHNFESFKCVVMNPSLGVVVSPSISPSFTINIKKMTLSGCGFPWEDISVIAKLPNLEVLKLRRYAFRGPVWEPVDEGFLSLEFLLLEALDVENLGTFHYLPMLGHLTIRHCYKLEFTDPDLFDESPLGMIEVDDCSPAIEIWAREMREKHKKNIWPRNIKVHIHSSRDAKNKA